MINQHRPPKLIDCQVHGQDAGSELLIVEGDSAAHSVDLQRCYQFQAVLPMQGKPINPMKLSSQKIINNPLYGALIQSIGACVDDTFNLTGRRYERVVLMMDANADGIHCGALLTLFFGRYMKPLLDAGFVWLVRPPTGVLIHPDTGQKTFAYHEGQFQKLVSEQSSSQQVTRFRGLASMPSDLLASECIHPQTRKQIQLNAKDVHMAQKIFT